jgi:hypothetical protein
MKEMKELELTIGGNCGWRRKELRKGKGWVEKAGDPCWNFEKERKELKKQKAIFILMIMDDEVERVRRILRSEGRKSSRKV